MNMKTKIKNKWHTEKWFLNRIGKTIYRDKIKSCPCDMCQRTSVDVGDIQGARYIYDSQNECKIFYQDEIIKP